MSNCNTKNKDSMDVAKQYLTYMNLIGTGALWAAKKYAPVSDFAKALGVLTAPGALTAQTALSIIGISENKTTPIVGGMSLSAPTLAFFGKVGAIVSTGAVIAGGTIATPAALVGAGLTIITIAAAAAGKEKIRDIITDPLLWENISSLDLEKTVNYFDENGVEIPALLGSLFESAFDGANDFGSGKIPHVECDFEDYKNLNRDGKYHVYDPLVLDLDGDGIETVGTQGYAGALFDHDKDGIRTSTGWVAADDGLLVIDRNFQTA